MKSFFRLAILALTFSLITTGIAFASGGTCSNFADGKCPSSIPSGVTSFYFIDYASGSDANSGTSESSPWQHSPGMANATSNAASHTPSAGEGWIFKGGVTVDHHAWPASVPWNGTASNPTYMGVDPGWYTGGSWSRPIMNGGGSSGYDTTSHGFFSDEAHHTNWLVVDNIEFTGLYFSGSPSFTSACYICAATQGTGGETNWEVKNVYAHGWSHGSGASDPAGVNGGFISLSANATPGQQSSLHDSIIDGSDSSKDCCEGSGAAIQYNNYYSYMLDDPYNFGLTTNGLVIFHDNHITQNSPEHIGGAHNNCFHSYAFNGTATGGTILLYNNFDDCMYQGTAAEPMAFELVGATVYAFNNVITAGNPSGISNSSWASNSPGTKFFEFNNTVQAYNAAATSGSSCYVGSSYENILFFADNFCISNNNDGGSAATFTPVAGSTTYASPTFSITCSGSPQSNLGMSQICAPIGNGEGAGSLNFAETYPFAPMDSTAASTIGTGQNNSVYCAAISAINAAAGTACLSDSTLGVSYDTSDHTVTYPYRTPIARPTITPWRNGAYEFASGQPNPPTALSAIVN